MKRLVVSIDFPPSKGGIQDYAYGLANALHEREAEDTLVLTNKARDKAAAEHFDRSVKFRVMRKAIYSDRSKLLMLMTQLNLILQLIWLRLRFPFQEIHFMNVFPIGVAGPVIRVLFAVKYLVYVHGLEVKSKIHHKSFAVILKILNKADYVVANSNYTKLVLENIGVTQSEIMIVPPGFNFAKARKSLQTRAAIRAKHGISEERKIMLTVGRLVERKGHDVVLHALKEVLNDVPDLLYIICGNGPHRKVLEDLSHELGISEHVMFAGEVSDEELRETYLMSDVFIMPSREIEEKGDVEGFGIVFLEASYYELPVIGGNSGGVPDAIRDNVTGYLVQPLDVIEIAGKIIHLLSNEELAVEMGRQGKEWVQEECLWQHRIQRLITL